MDTTTANLIRCFQTVFPALDPARIPDATADSVVEWDSVARIDIDFEEFEGAVSFPEILARLRQQTRG
jgi:hypothetical protein